MTDAGATMSREEIAAFAAFQEKFDKYKAALDKAAWRGVGAEVARAKTGFAEGIGVAAGSMALISKHSTDFYHVTTASGSCRRATLS
jgi:hypothetical protein